MAERGGRATGRGPCRGGLAVDAWHDMAGRVPFCTLLRLSSLVVMAQNNPAPAPRPPPHAPP
eukprot:CAMPEP_0182558856 /NCGR_PEP_ID=MMETSP1324-20130603/2197_1 /TAXON_ID=236786 /ORGANISM="Florenciella sp., Strain RCC1587" /LENGTH=61 /DNA_ID=CAMNT_0024771055 /DNA_START=515 /DNA_END=696 /DNA_ORIENTATION=-